MKLTAYLADRLFSLISLTVAGLLTAGLLWLIEVPVFWIAFLEALLCAAALASLLWDYRRRSRYYRRLFSLLEQLEEKTLLMEIAERPDFLDGQILSEILRQNQKYQNDRIAQAEREMRDYRDFLDTWVHEIKTPITSAQLIAANEKNPTTLRMADELDKIDRYVELVLYYARSGDVEKDFRVEQTTLQSLVSAALKSYAKPIIQAGGQVHLEQLDIPVRADRKSCVFVLGQLISNAVKYRQEALRLTFSARQEKNQVLLTVRDNGIGIPAADLPRVFDKGFTGQNGRRFPQSTGIGLYLCRKLCGRMNISLSVRSPEGGGTEVTLCFPTESLLRGAGL